MLNNTGEGEGRCRFMRSQLIKEQRNSERFSPLSSQTKHQNEYNLGKTLYMGSTLSSASMSDHCAASKHCMYMYMNCPTTVQRANIAQAQRQSFSYFLLVSIYIFRSDSFSQGNILITEMASLKKNLTQTQFIVILFIGQNGRNNINVLHSAIYEDFQTKAERYALKRIDRRELSIYDINIFVHSIFSP